MISVRKISLCRYITPTNTTALLHVYNQILTFTKLATYSASTVKSNFGNFEGINPFIPLGYAPADWLGRHDLFCVEWDVKLNSDPNFFRST